MSIMELAVMAVLVLLNGLFAGYEIALASVSLARLHILVRENRRGAKAAFSMKQNMEGSLAAVQVAITLVGASAAAIGGVGAAEDIQPFFAAAFGLSHMAAEILALLVVVVPLTFVTILFGELLPKVFGLRNKEWVCLRLSPTMRWFCLSIWPAVWVLENAVLTLIGWGERCWRPRTDPSGKTEAVELLEIRAQAASAKAKRLIGEQEEGIILRAARFSSRKLHEIMLPAEHIGMLLVNTSLPECLVIAHLEMHTRFPVAERAGDPDSILGYVNFKDIVALLRLSPQGATLRAILRPLPSLEADMKLAACLERLIREHAHIALVRNAAKKVVGMVTLEDVIEELVGDIQDEYDRLPIHATPSGDDWVVGGGLPLARLKELAGFDLAAVLPEAFQNAGAGESTAASAAATPDSVRTVSDWVIAQTNGHFRSGDVLERQGIRLVVRKVRRQKVLEAQIGRIKKAPDA